MSQHSSAPESTPVIYTIEQVNTVPLADWHAYVLAVTEAFWQLPEILRPTSQDKQFATISRSSELFPEPSMLAFCGEKSRPACLTIERVRSRNVLTIQELDFQQQPCDFFARVVMVLLHNLCPGHFRVHSTAGSSSWRLPQRWAECHLNMTLTTPQQPTSQPPSFEVDTRVVGSVTWLMLTLLTESQRGLSRREWKLIAEIEMSLYQPGNIAAD
ncbi:hypothetical protein GCM10023078_19920 [Gibbsiella greigii]